MPEVASVIETLKYVLGAGENGQLRVRLRFPGATLARSISCRSQQAMKRLLSHGCLEGKDRRILMRIYMAASQDSGEATLTGRQAYDILREVLETERVEWEDAAPGLSWEDRPMEGNLDWQLEAGGLHQPIVRTERANLVVLATAPPTATDPGQGRVREVECGFPHGLVCDWLSREAMSGVEAGVFYEEIIRRYPETTPPAPPAIRKKVIQGVKPRPFFNIRQREFRPRRGGPPVRMYVGELGFDYRGQRLRYASLKESATAVEGNELMELRRDRAFEKREARWLMGLGLERAGKALTDFELEDAGEDFVCAGEDQSAWYRFLAEAQQDLEARGWEFRFDGHRKLAVASADEDYVEVEPAEREGWFNFETGITVEGQRVNLLPLVHDLLRKYQGLGIDDLRARIETQVFFVPTVSGVTHVFSGERFFEIVERIFELYDRDPFESQGRVKLGGLRVAELIDAFGVPGHVPGVPEGMRNLAEVLREGISVEPATDVPGLRATLRDYQREGVGWLKFLADHGVNGILADDMGLGKTLQTIAHLAGEKSRGRLEKPALLVAPTSLMRNWADEVEKFAPGLRVLTLHGLERKRYFNVLDSADLILTTYGLIRIDAERHLRREYSWIILDEAQFIKNPDSQSTKVLCGLRARRKLCLTGTPVENHLGELWSLYHFLMPGFLGDAEGFRRQFRVPIEMEGSEGMRDILAKRVRPFLLRRKKSEVVTELPPKTEIDHPVEMAERQRDVYESVRVAMHEKVQAEIAERGLARSQLVILEALMKLRQICCDPRLARLSDRPMTRADSAKLTELMDFLPGMVAEGRRILLFSQFTSMLRLIEAEAKTAGIHFITLTGNTRDRGACVEAFQKGKVPLFLISLRAGGTGLNLTEADTVIHYDPWWNPAVESQATDRAYRIGQKQSVFVYKMITEDTVEEKIVEMQKRKAELAEGILSGTGSTKLKFEASDVAALFG